MEQHNILLKGYKIPLIIEEIISSCEGIGHGVEVISVYRGEVLESIESIAAVLQQTTIFTDV